MEFSLQYLIIILVIVLFVVAAVALASRRGERQTSDQDPYTEALKRLVDGDRDGAYAELQRAVKSGRAPTDAYIKLGSLLRERGQSEKALQIHQSLTVKTNLTRSEKTELFLNLAEDYARLGNSDRAVKVLETAVRNLQLRDPEVYGTLSRHYHLLGNHEKAYEALKESKRTGGVTDRELALYLASTGEQFAENGNPREARKLLQRSLKHDQECAPALLTLGNLADSEGEVDQAIELWRRVALLSPQLSGTALQRLERTLYEGGRFSEIERIYRDVRDARNGDEAANLSLAAFYKKQGRVDDAIQLLEDYLAVYPDSVRGALLLTSFYAKYRKDEMLDRFLDESMKRNTHTTQYVCCACDFRSPSMRWHCPRCHRFDSFAPDHVI